MLIKETIACETDELTHVYTLILHANNTYAVLIDNEEKAAGSLEAGPQGQGRRARAAAAASHRLAFIL